MMRQESSRVGSLSVPSAGAENMRTGLAGNSARRVLAIPGGAGACWDMPKAFGVQPVPS